jgi:hypothetical protein
MRQRCGGRAAQRHGAALAAFALHLHFGVLHIDPAAPGTRGLGTGQHVQTGQLGHPQAAAIKQLDHGGIAGFEPRIVIVFFVFGQLHRLVHP